MPRIIITAGALQGLERCRRFLTDKSSLAAKRAAEVIKHHLALLESEPGIGCPLDEPAGLRELIIPFGDSGYVALYHFDSEAGVIYVLAFRHQKEAGYGG